MGRLHFFLNDLVQPFVGNYNQQTVATSVNVEKFSGQQRKEAIRRGQMTVNGMMPTTDQVRTSVRFPMRLALKLRTSQGDIDAMTENISANGILFTGKRLPKVDTQIEFTVSMPAAVMGTEEDVSIHCIGRVVRHQQNGDEAQAAAIIDEYILRA